MRVTIISACTLAVSCGGSAVLYLHVSHIACAHVTLPLTRFGGVRRGTYVCMRVRVPGPIRTHVHTLF